MGASFRGGGGCGECIIVPRAREPMTLLGPEQPLQRDSGDIYDL